MSEGNDRIVRFEPSHKQFEAWQYLTDSITSSVGYGGGAHGGKTWLGCFWVASMADAYPGTRWLIGRKELVNLKRTTLPTFFKVCDTYGWTPGQDFEYTEHKGLINFKDSEIMLMDVSFNPSDPEYTRIGGLELTGAFIDQSEEILHKGIDMLFTRLGRQRNAEYGLRAKLFETFNPDKGHVYRRFYKPWREWALPPGVQFVPALPTDNPYTSREYIEILQSRDPITRSRLLEGNFDYDDDPTCLFDMLMISDIFAAKPSPDNADWYLTCDVARLGRDKTILMLWRGLTVVKIAILEKKHLDETNVAIDKFLTGYTVRRSHEIYDEDGVGGGLVDMRRGCSGFVGNSSPLQKRSDKVRPNFRNLRSQCYFWLADKVRRGEIRIECEDGRTRDMITEELGAIKQDNIGKDQPLSIAPKDRIKEVIGRSPDFADALMMRGMLDIKPRPSFLYAPIG